MTSFLVIVFNINLFQYRLFTLPKPVEAKVLLLGLDNAGKSTLLKAFQGETVTNLPPTKGFGFQKFNYDNITFCVWDLGGQKSIRTLWENYYQQSDVIIYVIDSSDNYRLDETGKELYTILQQPELNGIPVLIYANKQDLNLSLSPDEIIDSLNLSRITDRKWTIVACSALTKMGITCGLNWLSKIVNQK